MKKITIGIHYRFDRAKKNPSKLHPISLRVYQDRKDQLIDTEMQCSAKDWNVKKKKPEDPEQREMLKIIYTSLQQLVIYANRNRWNLDQFIKGAKILEEAEYEINVFNDDSIKAVNQNSLLFKGDTCFFKCCDDLIEESKGLIRQGETKTLLGGELGSIDVKIAVIRTVKRELGIETLPINELTQDVIITWLMGLQRKKLGRRTAVSYLNDLKRFYKCPSIKRHINKSIPNPFDDEEGNIKTIINLFENKKRKKKREKTGKTHFTLDEYRQLFNADVSQFKCSKKQKAIYREAQQTFILFIRLRGFDFCDWVRLKVDHIYEGKIVAPRQKIREEFKIDRTLLLDDFWDNYMNEYAGKRLEFTHSFGFDDGGDYVFNIVKSRLDNHDNMRKNFNTAFLRFVKIVLGADIAKKVKGIKISRHTYSTLAQQFGYSRALISALIGHIESDEGGARVTDNYMHGYEDEELYQKHKDFMHWLETGDETVRDKYMRVEEINPTADLTKITVLN